MTLIGGFGEKISGVEFSTMQSTVLSVLCMGTSLILLIAGTLATRKMQRIAGSADTRKFVDDAVAAEGPNRVLIRFGK
ncbi:hypothetical protein E3T61_13865 [Cryobacterium lactosi]|uniref:Uncharacterized protein n=1 Tax=Cryobacterium lactosi TaxID=1259202 RepID=A0A4R9BLZ8_9MICO|nr:hypothetical protein [Cryobacterium lactosi]TFD86956.1 hypothetical protein E3T61_13865 [Cryobacterium lactosi]